jgi:CheY-like chemotaxis protein
LDIGMPQLNGYEVAQALRQESWGAGITLIALTGWGQQGDRQRAIAAGFDRHLTKPVDPDALVSLIASPQGREQGERAERRRL